MGLECGFGGVGMECLIRLQVRIRMYHTTYLCSIGFVGNVAYVLCFRNYIA
jgi:hypothetical protein